MASLRDFLKKLSSGYKALTEKPKPTVSLSPQVARRAAQIPRARQSVIQNIRPQIEASRASVRSYQPAPVARQAASAYKQHLKSGLSGIYQNQVQPITRVTQSILPRNAKYASQQPVSREDIRTAGESAIGFFPVAATTKGSQAARNFVPKLKKITTKPRFSPAKDADVFRDQVIKGLENLDTQGLLKRGQINMPRIEEAKALLKRIQKNPKDTDALRKGAEVIKLTGTDYYQRGAANLGGGIEGAKRNLKAITEGIKKLGRRSAKPVSESSTDKIGLNSQAGRVARPGSKSSQLAEVTTTPKSALPQQAGKQLTSDVVQQTPSSTPLLPEADSAVNKLMAALKKAKPVRGKQEALYSAERSKRAGQAAAVGSRVPGEKGYIQQLSQLKGELPKKSFDEIRGQLGQSDIDSLFNQVEAANMPVFEKITTKTGLSKILGGEVPTKGEIRLLEEVFPQEFIKEILSKRTLAAKVLEGVSDVLSIPRTLMASIDLSAPLRQGVFLAGRPKQWAPAFKSMFKYFGSEKAYQASLEQIRSRPTYEAMRRSKLAIMEGGQVMTGREERFLSRIAEKVPGVRASNRAYTGFLNQLRADVFDDILKKAKRTGSASPALEDSLAKFVNAATGRGDLGVFSRSAGLLSQALFSPRLLASRLNLLNPRFYHKLEPTVRKEALKSLLTFAGMGTTVLTLAKMGGAEVSGDARSADFGKIKVGNTRYDLWGGFQQPIRAAAQMITGESVSSTTGLPYKLGEGYKPTTRVDIGLRFLQSKESPVLSFVRGLVSGENFIGDDFNVSEELINRMLPLVVQDLYELSQEPGQSAAMGIPAIFGVGTQTYGRQVPQLNVTPGGKLSVKGTSPAGLSETISNTLFPPRSQFDRELSEVKKLLQAGQITRDDAKARLRQVLMSDTVNRTNADPELRKQLIPGYVDYLKTKTKRQITTVLNDYTLTTDEKRERIQRIIRNFQQSAQEINSF